MQSDGAKRHRGLYIPLSDVWTRLPLWHSQISFLSAPWLHISCHHLPTVINLLQFNPFVVVSSLDLSKVFDTIRHSTLLSKLAELDLPTPVYN